MDLKVGSKPSWLPPAIRGRHVGTAALLATGALLTTLGAEVVAAIRHRFLPSTPGLELDGILGPEDGEPLVLVVLGDSSVAGVGADRAEDTLTYGVARCLAERYRVTLHALGVSGARLADVVGQQLPRLAELRPDVVLICVGTNDITHGTPRREMRRNLRALADGLAEVAPGAAVVVSGLPAADTALAFAQPLRALLGLRAQLFTRLYQRELARDGITVFDVAPAVRSAFRKRPEMFSPDLFHPSSRGYAYLGEVYGRVVGQAVETVRVAAAQGGGSIGLPGEAAS
jgi:lysophospholipase L1-like esterase